MRRTFKCVLIDHYGSCLAVAIGLFLANDMAGALHGYICSSSQNGCRDLQLELHRAVDLKREVCHEQNSARRDILRGGLHFSLRRL